MASHSGRKQKGKRREQMSESRREVGARLKEFRLSLRRTQREFAEELEWDVNIYRKIESGATMLTTERAQTLYEKYEIDINYILTGKKIDPDDFLKQIWITASEEKKKELLMRLLEYMEKMI